MKPDEFAEWDQYGAKQRGQIVSLHGDAAKVLVFRKTAGGSWEPTSNVTAVLSDALKPLAGIDASAETTKSMENAGQRTPRKGSVEHRVMKFSVLETRDATETENGLATAWILVNDYSLTDTYGTRFARGGAASYLNSHPNRPTLLYGHGSQGGITSALGHAIAWREVPEGLAVNFEFDNFDDVPGSRQAFSQLKSGTFDSFSIGFIRHADHYDEKGEFTSIDEYDLPEVSIVIEASNGGTKVLQLSGARMTQQDKAVQVLMDFAAGETNLADAVVDMRSVFVETRDSETDDGKVDCPTCDGTGKINANTTKCPDCDGSGKVMEERADELNGVAAEDRAAIVEYRSKYTSEQLAQMLKDGKAMANAKGDPSYPIGDADDLDKAIKMVGLGNKAGPTIRKHIMKCAADLGLSSKIPSTWNNDGTIGGRSVDAETEELLADMDIA